MKKKKNFKKYWKIAKNTGKVREKSEKFVSPKKWEPCNSAHIPSLYTKVMSHSAAFEINKVTPSSACFR